MTTWWKEYEHERLRSGDTSPLFAVAPNAAVLDIEFDNSYGGSEGRAVLIWTEQRVYFPAVYDGAEWLGSAPRHPQPDGQAHVGGEWSR